MDQKIIELMNILNIDPNDIYKAKTERTSTNYASKHHLYSKTSLKRIFGIRPREGEKPCHCAYLKGKGYSYEIYQIRQCEPIPEMNVDYSTDSKHKPFIEFMRKREDK